MTQNLFIAAALALCGFMLGMRQILLSPSHAAFPSAPPSMRGLLFIQAVLLGGGSVYFAMNGLTDRLVAGEFSPFLAMITICYAVINATHLYFYWRNRVLMSQVKTGGRVIRLIRRPGLRPPDTSRAAGVRTAARLKM